MKEYIKKFNEFNEKAEILELKKSMYDNIFLPFIEYMSENYPHEDIIEALDEQFQDYLNQHINLKDKIHKEIEND